MGSLSLDSYHFYFLMILKGTLKFLSLSDPVLWYQVCSETGLWWFVMWKVWVRIRWGMSTEPLIPECWSKVRYSLAGCDSSVDMYNWYRNSRQTRRQMDTPTDRHADRRTHRQTAVLTCRRRSVSQRVGFIHLRESSFCTHRGQPLLLRKEISIRRRSSIITD